MTALRAYRGRHALSRTLVVITTTIDALVRAQHSVSSPTTSTGMLEAETKRRAIGVLMADLFIAKNLVSAHRDKDLRTQAAAEARKRYLDKGITRPIESRGLSGVTIILPGGLRLKLRTPYLRPSRKGMRGRPRGTGKRGPGGTGCYPVLERLGIDCGATPLTRSLVAGPSGSGTVPRSCSDGLSCPGSECIWRSTTITPPSTSPMHSRLART